MLILEFNVTFSKYLSKVWKSVKKQRKCEIVRILVNSAELHL